MNGAQVVLFLLTLQIGFDLVEFFFEWKEFRAEVDTFQYVYYTTDPINPEEPPRSTQLTDCNKRISQYEKNMKAIKLKMFLKLITKFVAEVLTHMAGTFIFIFDLCLVFASAIFLCYKHKRG